jgi:hypothetical protein
MPAIGQSVAGRGLCLRDRRDIAKLFQIVCHAVRRANRRWGGSALPHRVVSFNLLSSAGSAEHWRTCDERDATGDRVPVTH